MKSMKWMKSTKLNNIIIKYHTPLNVKDETSMEDKIKRHHYWAGLLLLVRVVLYITAAIANSDGDPQLPLLLTHILIGGLLFPIIGTRLYSSIAINATETVILLNLLTFTAFSLYRINSVTIERMTCIYLNSNNIPNPNRSSGLPYLSVL